MHCIPRLCYYELRDWTVDEDNIWCLFYDHPGSPCSASCHCQSPMIAWWMIDSKETKLISQKMALAPSVCLECIGESRRGGRVNTSGSLRGWLIKLALISRENEQTLQEELDDAFQQLYLSSWLEKKKCCENSSLFICLIVLLTNIPSRQCLWEPLSEWRWGFESPRNILIRVKCQCNKNKQPSVYTSYRYTNSLTGLTVLHYNTLLSNI